MLSSLARIDAILEMLLALQKQAEGACYNCGKNGEVVRLHACSRCQGTCMCRNTLPEPQLC